MELSWNSVRPGSWGSNKPCSTIPASGFRWVNCCTFVLDIGDKTITRVSMIGDNLDTSVGKVDAVGSFNISTGILNLSLVEIVAGQSIPYAILICKGLRRMNFFNCTISWSGRTVTWSLGHGHNSRHSKAENKELEENILVFICLTI
jgi:hypothetical protein